MIEKFSLLLIAALAFVLASCGSLPLPIAGVADCSSETELFRDGFDEESGCGWAEFDGSDSAEIVDGVMRVSVGTNGVVAWTNPGQSFSDVEMSVLARQVAGPNNNAYGTICRYVDEENFYLFLVSGDGFYAIAKYQSGVSQVQYLTGEDPNYFVSSEVINQGVAQNQIRIRCEGSQLLLYANGSLLAQVEDATFTEGDIGLAASLLDDGQVVIEFDNVQVSTP